MASQATTTPTTTTQSAKSVDWYLVLTYTILITGAIISIFPFLVTISTSLMNLTEATSNA